MRWLAVLAHRLLVCGMLGLEELLMHAGYLDGRNDHAREIVYEQASFRTVRGLSDLNMHAGNCKLNSVTCRH
eukprot:SAG22_NODE_2145_length_2938_cov_1.732300_3_plen_72_part_00